MEYYKTFKNWGYAMSYYNYYRKKGYDAKIKKYGCNGWIVYTYND